MSPQSLEERKQILGIEKRYNNPISGNLKSVATSRTVSGISTNQNNSMNVSLLNQAHNDQSKETSMYEKKKQQLSHILSDEDIKSISIFKSKEEYLALKTKITRLHKMIVWFNLAWMILLGVINLLLTIVNTIMASSPLACYISFKMNTVEIEFSEQSLDENQKFSLLMELVNIVKSILFIFWFLMSS
jgi:hypothetical protein